jgi:hypothetical protein
MFAAAEDKGASSPSFLHQPKRYLHGDGTSVAALMTEEEIEAIMENFANEDTDYNKTWTRIVVEKMLSKVRTDDTILEKTSVVEIVFLPRLLLPFFVLVVLLLSSQRHAACPFLEQSLCLLRTHHVTASLCGIDRSHPASL